MTWRDSSPPAHSPSSPHRIVGVGLVAAQDRVDAGDELGGREGLDDVVVGAEAQPVDAVGLLPLGGQQDDRHPRAAAVAQRTHDLQPVDAGQHQVEHDEVRVPVGGVRERGVAVGRDPRLVAGALEVAGDDLGDRRLVVDDEHAPAALVAHARMIAAGDRCHRHAASLRRRCCRSAT
jgi:hypothetical protein